jgi:SAM-dependent methyltransferase
MRKLAQKTRRSNWQLETLSRILGGLHGKRLLDVGCGVGKFLLSAQLEGAEAVGCDLSSDACRFVSEQFGVPAYNQELHICSPSIGDVDVIVMQDLVEHLVEPVITFSAACSILKRGGLLLFRTPNAGAAGTNGEIARDWVGFRVDLEHFQYFSPPTVNWLAQKYGLGIERLVVSDYPSLAALPKTPRSTRGRTFRRRVIDAAKCIPCSHTAIRTYRGILAELIGGRHDPRMGTYHLYAILRKM